ncbi:MAG: sensor histidine kinase [bacterium]
MIKAKLPTWKNSLIFFGLICAMVMVYYLFQIQHARRILNQHILDHAHLVSTIVKHTAQGAVLSKELFDELMTSFLGNTARFIAYLDDIEPFEDEELHALATELGLSCIYIERRDKVRVSHPSCAQFLKKNCSPERGVVHDLESHLYVCSYKENTMCISLAVSAIGIEDLQFKTGLTNVISHITKVPGIKRITLLPSYETNKISFFEQHNERLAKVTIPLEKKSLEVELAVGSLAEMVGRLWRDFFIFGVGLAFLGIVLSYLIYRQQMEHIYQIRKFEDSLSKEREVAAIGRAAATIAHEIRNPLNAISMGIQRIQLEVVDLDQETLHFLTVIQKEITRVNESVENLLSYAKVRVPKPRQIAFGVLLQDIFSLYEGELKARAIKYTLDIQPGRSFNLDPDEMAQLIENLIKNAIDAQPDGGFVHIKVFQKQNTQFMSIKNAGFNCEHTELKHLLEPYFTTKSEGTGLGLYISYRIARAHRGDITLQIPEEGVLEATVSLMDIVEDT